MEIQAEDFKRLGVALKGADRAVARSLRKRIREAGKPLADKVADEGADPMPSSGGLAARLKANAKPRLALRNTGLDMVFSSNGRGKPDIASLNNRGRLRRPVWPDPSLPRKRWGWVNQGVESNTWSDSFEKGAEDVRPVLEKVLTDVMGDLRL